MGGKREENVEDKIGTDESGWKGRKEGVFNWMVEEAKM